MLPNRTWRWLLGAGFGLAVCARAFGAPAASSQPAAAGIEATADPRQAVQGLASADPAARKAAAEALVKIGWGARPAVLNAVKSPDPELRSGAAVVLVHLPWYAPDDPLSVRSELTNYAQLSSVDRRAALARLYRQHDRAAFEAILRVLLEDPRAEARWDAAGVLRTTAAAIPRLWKIDPDRTGQGDSAPVLAVVGWAWQVKDPARGIDLLRRSAELESRRPTADPASMAFVLDTLVGELIGARRYDEAASWARRRCDLETAAADDARDGGDDSSDQVFALFALHAEYGPLKGFAGDVEKYAAQLKRPPLMYAIGKLYDRCGQRILGDAIERAAFAAGLDSQEARLAVGQELWERGWYDLAERELRAVIAVKGQPAMHSQHEANARFRLAAIAARRGDDFDAAEQLRQALDTARSSRGMLRTHAGRRDERTGMEAEQVVAAEMHWYYLKAAVTKKDDAAAASHADALVDLANTGAVAGMDVALDLVPTLNKIGRADDARKYFARVYQQAKATLDAEPESPEAMNNLAWLCARCDERLEEALKLGQAAVAAAPENAAYLDTLAEVNFRLGRKDDAVKFETRALDLRPGDDFMKAQLERFKAGKKE